MQERPGGGVAIGGEDGLEESQVICLCQDEDVRMMSTNAQKDYTWQEQEHLAFDS
jgi:hypothetical protein